MIKEIRPTDECYSDPKNLETNSFITDVCIVKYWDPGCKSKRFDRADPDRYRLVFWKFNRFRYVTKKNIPNIFAELKHEKYSKNYSKKSEIYGINFTVYITTFNHVQYMQMYFEITDLLKNIKIFKFNLENNIHTYICCFSFYLKNSK